MLSTAHLTKDNDGECFRLRAGGHGKERPGGDWWDMEREKQTWRQGDSKATVAGLQPRDNGGLDQRVTVGTERSGGIWGYWGGNS